MGPAGLLQPATWSWSKIFQSTHSLGIFWVSC